MANFFKIKSKEKQEFVAPPSSSNCNCPAIMPLHFKDKFSDDQFRVYFCINPACGKVWSCLPDQRVNENPQAREYIKKVASELKIPKLDYATKYH